MTQDTCTLQNKSCKDEWKSQLANRIDLPRDLPHGFALTGKEAAFFAPDNSVSTLNFAVTRYFAGCANPLDPLDPLRKQFMPSSYELVVKDYETGDPLCEKQYEAVPFLVHRYPNRALFRVTSTCAMYCRFCYRRALLAEKKFVAGEAEVRRVAEYISSHPEIEELLLSGGDPLTIGDEPLDRMLFALRRARNDIGFRICTRVPVVLPQRITESLVSILKKYKPLRIVTQFNHPNEITDASSRAIGSFTIAGFPVLSQSVLLRGINNDASVLRSLFSGLRRINVVPYYLFQGDLAPGTSHFRVSIDEGVAVYSELERIAEGVPIPEYALDLPGGGGKVPVRAPFLAGKKDGWFLFLDREGKSFLYPAE
jgi:lysine 2,3-aminomutase